MLVSMLVLTLVAGTVKGEANLAQALQQAGRGEWSAPGVVEVEGFYRDRFRSLLVFTNGVGVRDRREQVRFSSSQVQKAFRLLAKARFAQLPEKFGGKPRPTHGPEVRALVRVRLGSVEKTVMQMRDGEQSKEFTRLVTGLLQLAEGVPAGVTAPPGWESLTWVLEGKLAPETLTCELALETRPKVFTTFSLNAGWYTLAFGDGKLYQGWMDPDQTSKLVKALLLLRSPQTRVRFYWAHQLQLRAGALGQEVEVVGMAWAGKVNGGEGSGERWGEFEQRVLEVLKELASRS